MELMGGIVLTAGLISAAALMGLFAARLILRAARPADTPEGRHGSEARP